MKRKLAAAFGMGVLATLLAAVLAVLVEEWLHDQEMQRWARSMDR